MSRLPKNLPRRLPGWGRIRIIRMLLRQAVMLIYKIERYFDKRDKTEDVYEHTELSDQHQDFRDFRMELEELMGKYEHRLEGY